MDWFTVDDKLLHNPRCILNESAKALFEKFIRNKGVIPQSQIQDEFIQVVAAGISSGVEDFDEITCDKDHKTHYCDRLVYNVHSNMNEKNYSREEGGQTRWLETVRCRAIKLAEKHTTSLSKQYNNTNFILPISFDVPCPSNLEILKQLMIPHIFPHLKRQDLLSLALVCKWTNDIVMNNTLSGIAIKYSRVYNKLISDIPEPLEGEDINDDIMEDFNLFFHKDLMTHNLISTFENFSTVQNRQMFTNYANQVCKKHQSSMKVLIAHDAGDATVVDNPEANGDSSVGIQSRKLFLIETNKTKFQVALVLTRHYGGFRHGRWEKPGNILGNVISAKEVKIGPIKATVEFNVLEENEKYKKLRDSKIQKRKGIQKRFEDSFGKTKEQDFEKYDVDLKMLIDNRGFSHPQPSQNALPFDFGGGLQWSLKDLSTFSNTTQKVILKTLDMTCRDEYNDYLDEEDNWEDNEMSDKLIKICSKTIRILAEAAFQKDVDIFMKLWSESDENKDEELKEKLMTNSNLPLKLPVRYYPKEWSEFTDEDHPQRGKMKSPINWYGLFTVRDTMNEGAIVFEN